jgi:hypothetical protein
MARHRASCLIDACPIDVHVSAVVTVSSMFDDILKPMGLTRAIAGSRTRGSMYRVRRTFYAMYYSRLHASGVTAPKPTQMRLSKDNDLPIVIMPGSILVIIRPHPDEEQCVIALHAGTRVEIIESYLTEAFLELLVPGTGA